LLFLTFLVGLESSRHVVGIIDLVDFWFLTVKVFLIGALNFKSNWVCRNSKILVKCAVTELTLFKVVFELVDVK